MIAVYVLIDPRNDVVRYVGITDDVYKRFSQHVQCSGNNIDKNEWIQELKSESFMLIMRTLEQVETIEKAKGREQYWIRYYLSLGVRLFNLDVAKSFTYKDFQSIFESKSKTGQAKNSSPLIKGELGSRVSVIMKLYPEITPERLAKKSRYFPTACP